MIDFEKCVKIYDELNKKHRTTPILDEHGENLGINKYTSSAREIEADIYNMRVNDEISCAEYYYIFGMICRSALNVGGADFYRV